jgi:SAM-dependent methyltransferase
VAAEPGAGIVSFDVAAAAYDRFMGRFSGLLSEQMADLAGVETGMDVIDVGCGTGALTRVLVARLGADRVTGVDPSESFVAAVRDRFPTVRIKQAPAESLPFGDDEFDAAIAQLVVHFMSDPVGGIREMARVTRPGGAVAACVWDHAGETGPLHIFWQAARELDPGVPDEAGLPGAREGHLIELFEAAGLRDVHGSVVTADDLEMATFDAYWEPFTRGVGPAGAYLASLDSAGRERLESAARALAGPEPFLISARAWAVRGRA